MTHAAPGYWMNETSGVLRSAVEAYLANKRYVARRLRRYALLPSAVDRGRCVVSGACPRQSPQEDRRA